MTLLEINLTFPLTDPVVQFLLILLIILITPILFNRIRVPSLLGLILAGTAIGPHGFSLIARDSSFLLFGTAGLLFIMFQAGLDTDITEFKKNSKKSAIFGSLTFLFPFLFSFVVSYYLLGLGMMSSLLIGGMVAPHTPITYPIVTKFGIQKDESVSITLGGTLITNIISFLIIIVVVGMSTGTVNQSFWVRLSVSVVAFAAIIAFLFPLVTRWFFKTFQDNTLQFVFVLVMLFLGAFLAELAGIEKIIGALFTGIALNRLIPRTSPLMSRIHNISDSIFIPFFLISIGMLVNLKDFIKDIDTIKVAIFLTLAAILSKYLAAWATQKKLHYSPDQRRIINGLSSAQAASTLAVVMVGYNIITGVDANGEPIRLLNDAVLNGTLMVVLISCTTASLHTQIGAKNIARKNASAVDADTHDKVHDETEKERILIPVSNLSTVEELVNLSMMIKSSNKYKSLYGLNIITNNEYTTEDNKMATKVLEVAAEIAAGCDNKLIQLLRHDVNIVNGITNVIKENKITDLVLGIHNKKGLSKSFIGNLNEGILAKSNVTTFIYKSVQPISTIRRHLIFVPENAEKEAGFPYWLLKIWNIYRNSCIQPLFYGSEKTLSYIKEVQKKHTIACQLITFSRWDDFLILSRDIGRNDNLIFILSRKDGLSYHPYMNKLPDFLNSYFNENSFILIYPIQVGANAPELSLKVGKIEDSIDYLFRGR